VSEQDDLVQNIATAGTIDLKALLDDMAEALELTVGDILRLGPFLSRAWIAGAKAFQTEMLARAIEEGDAD
jgi:hypothetical protein